MIDIKKTYKNYVDGKYVRSESGKTYTKELKNEFYELPLTSKKDIRTKIKINLITCVLTNTVLHNNSSANIH